MSKSKEVEEKSGVPAQTSAASLPAHLRSKMAEDSGKGLSTKAEDNIVPLVYVLQSNSPQVNTRDPKHIDGAGTGDIWLRNSSSPIVHGDEGITVQPCFFHKAFVEWIPREKGGGFVAQHIDLPADAKEVRDPQNPNKVKWIRPNGNEVIETRYHSVLVYPKDGGNPLPYVIPFVSTGHSVSRAWMFMMNAKLVDGVKAASYAGLYLLKTKERKNAAGTWYQWDVTDAGWVPDERSYEYGQALFAAFESGQKTAEAPMEPMAEDDQM